MTRESAEVCAGQVSDDPRVEEDFFADRELTRMALTALRGEADPISDLLPWSTEGCDWIVMPRRDG